MSHVTVTSLSNLQNQVSYGADHSLITDEPVAAGGEDAGPDPYTLLLAALGSVLSKCRCPVFLANEMSGFGF